MICIFKNTANKKQLIETNGEYILDNICTYGMITEGLNDEFTLEIDFEILAPVKKELYDLITEEGILKVEDEYGDEFFVISEIYKTSDSIRAIARQITIAETLDLFLEDVRPENQNGAGALTHIFSNTTCTHEIVVNSDIQTISTAYYNRKTVYEALHDSDMAFQERWGGEVYRRQFNLHINNKVGSYRGVKIKSNKNLTGFEENTTKDTVCTRIYPKGFNGITIEEKYIDSENIGMYKRPISRVYTFEDVKVRDENTGEDEEVFETLEEAQEELKERAKALFEEDKVDFIKAYYTINHVDLRTTEEYKNYSATEMTCIGDEVDVEEETLGIDIRTRVVKRKYNILTKEREETELSNVGLKRVITLPDLEKEFEKIPSTESFLEAAKEVATGLINAGIKNSHVVVRKNEILIMDTDDINTAKKVWRFNVNGLGYSSTGYYGEFGLAMTMDGSIVADFINVGILNANLIKTGTIMSANGNLSINIDEDFFEVTHTGGNTRTRIDAEGFYILDENNETIASLSSKESWTELKADKVFAKNIENVYIGDSNLYVDHNSNNIIRNGSIDYPFTDFNQLREYVQSMPIINKDLFIYVVTEGVVNDLFYLTGLSGNGKVDIRFNNKFILKTENDYGVVLRNISNWVSVYGGRTSYQSKDGFMIQATNGIEVINCSKFELSSLLTDTSAYGIHVQDSHGKMDNIDFCKAYSALGVRGGQVWLSGSCRGSNTKAVRAFEGTLVTIGENDSNSIRQQGILEEVSGTIKEISTIVETASTVYAPVIPPTINTYKDFSITSMATYQYLWSNWKVGECKSGVYGSYGDKAGHLFFDLSAIRSFLNGGTVLDGATITLTRANSGGSSSGVKIYVGGSSCNGASGTPSYYNKTYVGTLSWGQTNTFTLSKSIVDGIKNGTINSITTHGSDYSNITACSINLKINK